MQEIIPEKEITALFAYKTQRIKTLKIDDEI